MNDQQFKKKMYNSVSNFWSWCMLNKKKIVNGANENIFNHVPKVNRFYLIFNSPTQASN